MAEYIEREAVLKKLTPYTKDWYDVQLIPIADVAEVKHGAWVEMTDSILETYYSCSNCKEDFYFIDGGFAENLYKYCPNCGAKMDGKGGGE